MPRDVGTRFKFDRPEIDELRRDGFRAVDMHVHSRFSDGAPSVRAIVKDARRRGIGVAITDHNDARCAREIRHCPSEALAIPGIELDAAEGPHILLYFYACDDLVDFFDRHIRDRRHGAQYMTSRPTANQIIDATEGYACLKIGAHPFGYFGLDRGVLKCEARHRLPGVVDRLDGIEAICGGMNQRVNERAAAYAIAHDLPATGGTDAHILREIGNAVTGVRADTTDAFLDGIARRESIVVGSSAGILTRGLTAGVIGVNYIPYAASALHARIGRPASRFIRSH
jgi:predicted metal-dependent phosphoesterase TrpH